MTGSGIRLPMQAVEAQHLADLVAQFLDLLRDTDIGDDTALNRLTPAVYPGDAEASAEFADATRADLLDRRAADARMVQAGLDAFGEEHDPTGELLLGTSEVDAWLRTLTALRLVIASRLGIDLDPAPDPEDPRLGVYEWLGYRLELLVEAADEVDGI
ncbi:MAG: DUF2017 family protein [Actinobacteria bacterium]|nr:DUF2017 family protein [Actinomycetota bacterium]